MSVLKPIPDDLGSLLRWFDINYLDCIDEKLVDEIAAFDINSPSDQDILIERFMVPEFRSDDEINKRSMMSLLAAVPNFREDEVRKVLNRTLLFTEPLNDYRTFFEKVRRRCEELSDERPGAPAGSG